MFEKLKRILASAISSKNIPESKSIPTDRFGYSNFNTHYKSTIPRNPSYRQLREFAKNPIVSQPIEAVKDRIAKMEYEIRPKVRGRKYTKQIKLIKNIIDNPNIDQTRRKFEAMILDDILTLDAGAFEVCKSKNPNHPLFLYPIDGATVQHVVPMDYTDIDGYKYMQINDNGNTYFTRSELCFLAKNNFTHKPFGLSPVLKAYDYIRYYIEGIDKTNEDVNTKTSGMLINLGETATSDEVEKFREYFMNEIEGTGRVPIVGGTKGLDTKQIRSFTEDALYQSWFNLLITMVCSAFPYPVEKMINVSADRSTTEDFEIRIIEELVKPYANLLEDAYNTHVINVLGFGDILEFKYVYEDSESLKTQKWTRFNNAFTTGTITINEWRTGVGFSPLISDYANLAGDERKAVINKELGMNGFNGVGNIKDTSDAKNKKVSEGGG